VVGCCVRVLLFTSLVVPLVAFNSWILCYSYQTSNGLPEVCTHMEDGVVLDADAAAFGGDER